MTDASYRPALQRLVEDSREIELQFRPDVNLDRRPIVSILQRARRQAAADLDELIETDITLDTIGKAQKLQNGVRRFRDLVRWTVDILEDGRMVEREFEAQDREEMEQLRAMLADELGPEVSPEEVGLSREGVDA